MDKDLEKTKIISGKESLQTVLKYFTKMSYTPHGLKYSTLFVKV